MIGWVPLVLVDFLDTAAGEAQRRAILASAGLDADASNFRLDTDVPDPACRRMIEAACSHLGLTEQQAFDGFAPHFVARAQRDFPGFFRGIGSLREFLLRQPAIHNCLAAGLREPQRKAVADKFVVTAIPRGVRVHYHSQNRLAALYVSVAHVMARHYGETVDVSFTSGCPSSASCIMEVAVLAGGANSRIGNRPGAVPVSEIAEA